MKDKSIAIYLRISVEDKEKETNDSKSILNQRSLLLDYIQNFPDLSDLSVQEFCDDGISGKNFSRPSFQSMINAVKHGDIRCILVKDFSRFGRDYITVGGYLSYFFPFFNVRFISVLDNFDSSRPGDIDSLDVAFKNLTYDFYSRDLSAKVRQAKSTLTKEGNFISPFAPYGYKKDPKNTQKLIPDTTTAPIVQRIFSLAVQGFSTREIAKKLNDCNTPTPLENRKIRKESINSWKPLHDKNFWVEATVKRILCNEHYLGWIIYGKRTREKVGNPHVIPVQKENWIVVKDTHEPLVSLEIFQQVSQLFRVRKPLLKPSSCLSLFPKLVHCTSCGFTMERRGRSTRPYYCCSTSGYTNEFSCSPKLRIYEDDLSHIVLNSLKPLIQSAVAMDKIFSVQNEKIQKEIQSCFSQLKIEENLCSTLIEKGQLLYESFICASISKDAFLREKNTILNARLAAEKRVEQLQEQLTELSKNVTPSPFIEHYKKYDNVQTLSSEMTQDLIHSILISPNGSIEIVWNFADSVPSRF